MTMLHIANKEELDSLLANQSVYHFDFELEHSYRHNGGTVSTPNYKALPEIIKLEDIITSNKNTVEYKITSEFTQWTRPSEAYEYLNPMASSYKRLQLKKYWSLKTLDVKSQKYNQIQLFTYHNEYTVPDIRNNLFPEIKAYTNFIILKLINKDKIAKSYLRIDSDEPRYTPYTQREYCKDISKYDVKGTKNLLHLFISNPITETYDYDLPLHYIQDDDMIQSLIKDKARELLNNLREYVDLDLNRIHSFEMNETVFNNLCSYLLIPQEQSKLYWELYKIFNKALTYMESTSQLLGVDHIQDLKYRDAFRDKLDYQEKLIHELENQSRRQQLNWVLDW